MMFLAVASLLILVAVAFVVAPLIFRKNTPVIAGEDSCQQHANLASFNEQRSDIESRVASGLLRLPDAEELKLELEKKLLNEISSAQHAKPSRLKVAGVIPALIMGLLVPTVSLGLYSQLGAHTELEVTRLLGQESATTEQVNDALKRWVEKKPDNAQALYLLGSNYFSMGRIDEAVEIYRTLYRQSDKNSRVSSELAQALFLQESNMMTFEVRQLYQEALALDPANTTALGLQGIDAFGQQRYRDAVIAWQTALKNERDPIARQALVTGIAKARALSGEKLSQIRVRVAITPELKKLPANTRVIVFARESGTKKPPIAAVPVTLGELPMEIVLDDQSAMMMGGGTLSGVAVVDVFARISLSGDVKEADYQAVVEAVKPSGNTLVKVFLGETD
ncbi:c-type cytochrome biogenesis protein CcmI [Endozoicomonas sp. Mp262]|uniref:c-type cytochrome biogenesis protein CcmI n=1 Tax=Endozoicomonas sp. Mp262 TaxID=2919499 RepID=UPI0021D8AC24